MYITAIVLTLSAWLVGLLLDANISEPLGFLYLRVLLPVMTMGLCILKAVKNSNNDK